MAVSWETEPCMRQSHAANHMQEVETAPVNVQLWTLQVLIISQDWYTSVRLLLGTQPQSLPGSVLGGWSVMQVVAFGQQFGSNRPTEEQYAVSIHVASHRQDVHTSVACMV